MWNTKDPEKKIYIDLGFDEDTAEKLSGGPGGIWYDLKVIFYGCLPLVFIVLFVFDLIDLKSLLIIFLIWLVGNLICELLHRIFNYIRMSSIIIPKILETTNEKIDKIDEKIRPHIS